MKPRLTSAGKEMMNDERMEAAYAAARAEMVAVLRAYGIRDERVLEAMSRVRRHRFFPGRPPPPQLAYGDHPCPIACGQTISQPFIVAFMTAALAPAPGKRVLEIGTGSGYQAAVLAELGAHVHTVERHPFLAAHAARVLAEEGYGSVRVRCADGYEGWRDEAPFDGILVTCAPPRLPEALTAQLAEGGVLVAPVGVGVQRLLRVRRAGGRLSAEDLMGVRFVPMTAGLGEETTLPGRRDCGKMPP